MSFLLNKALATTAIEVVFPAIEHAMQSKIFKRPHLHIVIMDPTQPYTDPSVHGFESSILYEHSIGDKKEWKWPYDRIARGKAKATWRTGLPTHVLQQCAPHLLRIGDTSLYGSVNYQGIIVACSGVQPYFDEMIAAWIAATCLGFAKNLMQTEVLPKDEDFLGDEPLKENKDASI